MFTIIGVYHAGNGHWMPRLAGRGCVPVAVKRNRNFPQAEAFVAKLGDLVRDDSVCCVAQLAAGLRRRLRALRGVLGEAITARWIASAEQDATRLRRRRGDRENHARDSIEGVI